MMTPGVLSVVGYGKSPVPIPLQEIESIRAVVTSGLNYERFPFLQSGQQVCIVSGVLAGIQGLLVTVKKTQRLVLSVELLQRSVIVEVDPDCVDPIAGLAPPPGGERWRSAAFPGTSLPREKFMRYQLGS